MLNNIRRVRGCTCNPATGRLDGVVGLRLGILLKRRLCRSGVRTMTGIDMGRLEKSERSRLNNEERVGPGGNPSSQKFPVSSGVAPVSNRLLTTQSIQLSLSFLLFFLPFKKLRVNGLKQALKFHGGETTLVKWFN